MTPFGPPRFPRKENDVNLTINVDPMKLAQALTRQADGLKASTDAAKNEAQVIISATASMLLYSIAAALNEAMMGEPVSEPMKAAMDRALAEAKAKQAWTDDAPQ